MRLTDEQVREIKARAEKAMDGPWSVTVLGGAWTLKNSHGWVLGQRATWDERVVESDANGAFIAHARTDIPALLADRAALVAEIAELKTRMAEGFSAREGQVENGAKMIAELRAENAKLRKVIEQVAGPDPGDVEAVARALIWVDFGPSAFLKHGTFGVNDPEFVSRHNHRAREVLSALIERGWTKP